MTRTYRPGALGAMMDEYERAAVELTNLLETVDAPRFVVEYPPEAEKCRSIQKIMRHVIRAAYGCANDIRAALNMPVTVTLPTNLEDKHASIVALQKALNSSGRRIVVALRSRSVMTPNFGLVVQVVSGHQTKTLK